MIKILYDASVLGNGIHKNSNRSGIFIVGLEILRELLKHPELKVDLYSAPSSIKKVHNVVFRFFPEFSGKLIVQQFPLLKILDDEFFPKVYQSTKLKYTQNILSILYKCVNYLPDRYWSNAETRSLLNEYDVFFSPVYLAPWFVRKSQIPCFTILHDTIPKIYPQFSPFTMLGLSWNFDLIRNLNENDFCFANSECTKRDFLRFSPRLKAENVSVIPLAASEKFYQCSDSVKKNSVKRKYKIPEHKKYMLSLCTIEPRKNLIFAIQAYSEFLRKNKIDDLVFVLAGGRWARFDRKWKNALAEMPGLSNNIILPGYIDDEDLAALYSGAEMFIYPSLYEGFGLPPLEAMQCGCPVITSNTSSLPEVVGEGGIMIDPYRIEDAVHAMESLYFDRAVRLKYIEKGIERAKKFSWESAADIIVKKFNAAVLEKK